MKMEELREKLAEIGIDVKEVTVQKNGISCIDFQVITKNETISPIVYYSPQESLDAFLAKIKEAHDMDYSKICIPDFCNQDYVVLEYK